MRKYKYIIVLDTDDKWYVRRVVNTTESNDSIVYRCDKPLGKAHPSLLAAVVTLNRATGRSRVKRKC